MRAVKRTFNIQTLITQRIGSHETVGRFLAENIGQDLRYSERLYGSLHCIIQFGILARELKRTAERASANFCGTNFTYRVIAGSGLQITVTRQVQYDSCGLKGNRAIIETNFRRQLTAKHTVAGAREGEMGFSISPNENAVFHPQAVLSHEINMGRHRSFGSGRPIGRTPFVKGECSGHGDTLRTAIVRPKRSDIERRHAAIFDLRIERSGK